MSYRIQLAMTNKGALGLITGPQGTVAIERSNINELLKTLPRVEPVLDIRTFQELKLDPGIGFARFSGRVRSVIPPFSLAAIRTIVVVKSELQSDPLYSTAVCGELPDGASVFLNLPMQLNSATRGLAIERRRLGNLDFVDETRTVVVRLDNGETRRLHYCKRFKPNGEDDTPAL